MRNLFSLCQFDDPVWGTITIWRPFPYGDHKQWGILHILRDTLWEPLIPVVNGTSLSHALHGYSEPLMDEIGADPKELGRRIPDPYRVCDLYNVCPMATKHCHPSGGKELPDCYQPPLKGAGIFGADSIAEATNLVSFLTLSWRDGQYIVVVEGEEFSI